MPASTNCVSVHLCFLERSAHLQHSQRLAALCVTERERDPSWRLPVVAASQQVLHVSLGAAKHAGSKGPFSEQLSFSDVLAQTDSCRWHFSFHSRPEQPNFNLISQGFKMHCLAELKTGGSSNASSTVWKDWKLNPSIVFASMTCLMLSWGKGHSSNQTHDLCWLDDKMSPIDPKTK